jgi:cellulose synthase/poly-beta-1,6-N-acetylglucosamine synthase-like glycosyltransferase
MTYLALEARLTQATLAFTLAASSLLLLDLGGVLAQAADLRATVESLIFVAVVAFLIYGNLGYQLTRLGHLDRLRSHVPATDAELDAVYQDGAAPLVFLVPSYREELRVVRQTLLSAALQAYPNRRVVLLIDDPALPGNRAALAALAAARAQAIDVDGLLLAANDPLQAAWAAYRQRARQSPLDACREAAELAQHLSDAATWFDGQAAQWAGGDHTDRFFAATNLAAPAQQLRAQAARWHTGAQAGVAWPGTDPRHQLDIAWARLGSLFAARVTSFERKRYANLPDAPNKAMNLNAYIALLGGCYREEARADGRHLVPAPRERATLCVADASFLVTLDADSLLLPGYALRLVQLMSRPGNERIAVAQTPYSAIPQPAALLERVAGATTDIQYLIHQGLTRHHATFWVGANVVLRRQALEDIATVDHTAGFPVTCYIQDRTVIEDTESTVDLIARGWRLENYPERLAFSATAHVKVVVA